MPCLEPTPAELQIAALVAAGLTDREIAARTGWPLMTVKSRLRMLSARLDVRRRVSVAIWYDRTYGSRDAARDVLRELAARDPAGFVELLREVFG